MEALATPEQVAEYLGVKPHTLAVWVTRKKGPPFYQVEGARRYDMEEVKAWLEERRVQH